MRHSIPWLALLLLGAAPPAAEPRPEQPYRFTLRATDGGQVRFRGLLRVDDRSRHLDQRTPFAFECEAGSVITGYFEVVGGLGRMRLDVYDPSYSKRRPAASARRFERLRFAWARPGVGPRCLDAGAVGICGDALPTTDAPRPLPDAHESHRPDPAREP